MGAVQLVVKETVFNVSLILAKEFLVQVIHPSNVKRTIVMDVIDYGEEQTEKLSLVRVKPEELPPLNELQLVVRAPVNSFHHLNSLKSLHSLLLLTILLTILHALVITPLVHLIIPLVRLIIHPMTPVGIWISLHYFLHCFLQISDSPRCFPLCSLQILGSVRNTPLIIHQRVRIIRLMTLPSGILLVHLTIHLMIHPIGILPDSLQISDFPPCSRLCFLLVLARNIHLMNQESRITGRNGLIHLDPTTHLMTLRRDQENLITGLNGPNHPVHITHPMTHLRDLATTHQMNQENLIIGNNGHSLENTWKPLG